MSNLSVLQHAIQSHPNLSARHIHNLEAMAPHLEKRDWSDGLQMLIRMVEVAREEVQYAKLFQKWLNKEAATLLLWELTERFRKDYQRDIDFFNARTGIDTVSFNLSLEGL